MQVRLVSVPAGVEGVVAVLEEVLAHRVVVVDEVLLVVDAVDAAVEPGPVGDVELLLQLDDVAVGPGVRFNRHYELWARNWAKFWAAFSTRAL